MIHPKLPSLLWDAWRAERAGPAAIIARQSARLADLIGFARARSPLYRDLYRHLPTNVADLRQLPPVTKPQLMARFDEWVTDPAVTRAGLGAYLADPSLVGQPYFGRYTVLSTSGVTGDRGIFLHDPDAMAVYRALTLLRGWLPRMSLGRLWPTLRRGNRLAALVTVGGHYGGVTIMETARRDHPWPFNQIRTFSVLQPLPELVRALNEFQPAQLIGYPSALTLLASEQAAGRLAIRPAIVACGGDALAPRARRRIAESFRRQVRENYGASEMLPLGWDCWRERIHLAVDWAILEPVDEQYRPVPPGRPSYSALLTNLANRIQPIIRYELGDTVTIDPDRCPCGSPLPTVRVEGRRDEILYLQGPSGTPVPLQPFGLGRVVNETPGVERAQVVQTGPATLTVRLEIAVEATDREVWETMMGRLRHHLLAHGLPHVAIERTAGPPQRAPGSGKFRRVYADLGMTRTR